VSLLATTALALGAFWWVERHSPEPLLPLDLFENGTILLSAVVSLLIGFIMFAIVYYTPLLLQGGLGLSPSAAGALQTPLAVSTALGSLTSGQIFARARRMRPLLLTGGALLLLGAVLLLTAGAGSNPWVLSAELALTGVGIGMQLPMITILVQSIVPRSRLGVGTATIQFLRLIGSTVGTAVVGSAVTGIFASDLARAVPPGTDPRLAAAFHNPQVLVSPEAQSQIASLARSLGPAGQADMQALMDSARAALISGIRVGYILALATAAVVLVLLFLLRLPDYRSAARDAAPPEAAPSFD
jgi:MFS family permease